MHMGSTLLALALCGLIGVGADAQVSDPLAPSAPKTGIKPGSAKAKKPVPAARKKGRSTSTRSARMRQAQMQAQAFRANQFVMPPNTNGSTDPLNLANALSGGLIPDGNGNFGNGNFGNGFGNADGFNGGGGFGYGPGQTATGGYVGRSDRRLIRGFDGDGQGDFAPTPGFGFSPRIERVQGGNHIAGIGVPLRKGERVNAGNLIPGYGVIGQTMDATVGGTHVPGYGVIGSYDPRVQNQPRDQVVGGSYVPGFGVVGGSVPQGFGNTGTSGFYGAGALAPSYRPAMPQSFGATIPSSYGASALPGARR